MVTAQTTPSVPVFCIPCGDDTIATQFTDPHAEFDPMCDACFARDFAECPNCGAFRPHDLLRDVETVSASWSGPAESETGCDLCMPEDDGREPDPDRDPYL